MNKRVITFLVCFILGLIALVGLYYALPHIINKNQKTTSDGHKIKDKITIGVDSWIGYYPLCSKKMKSEMRILGYILECVDDKADTAGRMALLKSAKYQFAVASVDSYLVNGAKENFPATIITVIDESRGGDAIIAKKDKVGSLEGLKKKKSYKMAFTPQSPSEHLYRAILDHFDVPKGVGTIIETNGSEEAYKKLLAGDVDVAILWEPFVTKILNTPDYIKILGTEDTEKLIVDILLVNREFSINNPKVVGLLLSSYFKSLKFYKGNLEVLKKEIKNETKLSDSNIDSMLKGVSWVNLFDNAISWFG